MLNMLLYLALLLILYISGPYMVTLDCVGGANPEGACTAERVELTVWGKHLSLEPALLTQLLTEARNRVNQCYATRTMISIQPNGK